MSARITAPSAASTKALVDRGLALRAAIAADQKELKAIAAELEDRGLNGRQVELKDEDRTGRRYLARGTAHVVPVTFTADFLISQFTDGSEQHTKIGGIAGTPDKLRQFFKPKRIWENLFDDGKDFRKSADELLGMSASSFIDACLARDKHGIPKSDVKVDWGKAEEIGKGA